MGATSGRQPELPETVPSTDEVTVRLHDLGGDGPLLLLAHATGLCGGVWAPLVETLGRRFRCVALDFRAHGESTGPIGRPLVWHGMAEDVLAVVTLLSPDRPVPAVGHSMGGAVLALAETARPGTIARAWTYEPILFEAHPDGDGPRPSEISEGARRRRPTFPSRAEAFERYRSRPPLSLLDERALQAYIEYGFEELPGGSVTLRCRPEDESSVFEHHFSGVRHVLGDLAIPYLVAVGGDGARPAVTGREAVGANPHLELASYPELGHFGPLEDPDRIAADILNWMP